MEKRLGQEYTAKNKEEEGAERIPNETFNYHVIKRYGNFYFLSGKKSWHFCFLNV